MVSLLGPTGLRYAGREAARFLLEFWRGRPEFRAAHRADAVIWQVARSLYACFGPWHEPPRGARVGDAGGLRARLPRRRLPVLRGERSGRRRAAATRASSRLRVGRRRAMPAQRAPRPAAPCCASCRAFSPAELAHAASLFVEDLTARQGLRLVRVLVGRWCSPAQRAFCIALRQRSKRYRSRTGGATGPLAVGVAPKSAVVRLGIRDTAHPFPKFAFGFLV